MKIHSGHVSLIVVYAPTNEDQVECEQFYQDLQHVMSMVARYDMVLVVEDFNAQVGKGESGWKGMLCEHSPDLRN